MEEEGPSEERPLLVDEEEEPSYTGDRSVDIVGKPARRHRSGNWKASLFILGYEFCERFAYYGISYNLVTYLLTKLHQGAAAAAIGVNAWQGTCFFTPLIGAVFAETFWGKYRTIVFFSTVYFTGMIVVTLSASVPLPESLLFCGLYMIALGAGGTRPCVSSFVGDQFDYTDKPERRNRGHFFTWLQTSMFISSIISSTVQVWLQDNLGWALGFGIPTVSLLVAMVSFFVGSKIYRYQKPKGSSPVVRACQVIVAAIRKSNVQHFDTPFLHEEAASSRRLEHTNDFRFLDKAATVAPSDTGYRHGSPSDPWKLCTVTQVEEVKILMRMLPVWAAGIPFSLTYAQSFSTFIEQGMALNTRVGFIDIPPASMYVFNVVAVVLLLPEGVISKLTGNSRGLSELQRIGVGLFLSVLAMSSAALLEAHRLERAESSSPVSILWQIPQYLLLGAGEAFARVGQLEYFHSRTPPSMRSVCTVLAFLAMSAGSLASSAAVAAASRLTGRPGWIPDELKDGRLDLFFGAVAAVSLLNLLLFVLCATRCTTST